MFVVFLCADKSGSTQLCLSVEIEVELPQWMIDKAEKKHLDLSKILTEELEKEIERLAKEKRERDRKEKKKEKKS